MTVMSAPENRTVVGTIPGNAARPESLAGVHSLYVHIPFCERKCEYCDFVSVAGRRGERAYVAALCAELRMLGAALPGVALDTIFVGGGTPSFIEPDQLAAVMDAVRSGFRINHGAEVTLEANPSSTTRERASAWRAAGFNRVSIGVQSLDDDALRFLGRVHDARRALGAIDDARAAGFVSINCDLIYAVPGLDDARWERTLQRVVAAGPSHVSCYELTVESGTPLHVAVARGRVRTVDPTKALGQHWLAVELLAREGYRQYEVSNFAMPGAECRHNLVYWRNGYYVAAGVGAHGHLPIAAAGALGIDAGANGVALRYWHGRGIGAFAATTIVSQLPIHGCELITSSTREFERIMLGLRLAEGIAIRDARIADKLSHDGLVAISGGRIRTTRRGQELLEQVVLRIAERTPEA